MATQQVNIQITVTGANPAANQIAGIGTAAAKSHKSLFTLRNLLLGFTVKNLVVGLAGLADTATRIDNRLNVLTGSVARSNELFDALFKVSQNTRSGLESTIDAYARLERSTVGLNLTSQQLIDLTQGINQSFQIFGNSSKEAEAALVQFSQGLSVGVLRGDELRSVLEQAPRLAKAIADGLNEIPEGKELSGRFGRLFRDFESGAISSEILAGGLRELGKEGKLTSEVITKGLLTQLPKLNEEFARTAPTIQNGFTLIQNALIDLARSPEFKEFSKNIGEILISIADWITQNKGLLVGIGITIKEFIVLIFDLGKIFVDTFMTIADAAGEFFQTFADLLGLSSKTTGNFAKDIVIFLGGAFSTVYKLFKDTFKAIIAGTTFIGALFASTGKNIVYAFTSAFDFIVDAAQGLVNTLIDGINIFRSEQDKIAKVDFSPLRDAIKEDFTNPVEDATRVAQHFADTVDNIAGPFEQAGAKSLEALDKFVTKSGEAITNMKKLGAGASTISTLGTIPGGKEILPAEAPLDANDQRRLDSFLERMKELQGLLLKGKEGLSELAKAQDQYNKLAADPDIAKRLQDRATQEAKFAELKAFYTDKVVQELIAENKAEKEAAEASLDHYAARRLLTQALKNGLPVTAEMVDQLAAVLKEEREVKQIQQEKENILQSLTRKSEQYNSVLAATNQLLSEGKISEAEQTRRLNSTELGAGVKETEKFLGENSLDPTKKTENELRILEEEFTQRQDFISQMQALDVENYTKYQEQLTDLTEIYTRQRSEIEMASQSLQYQNASTAFGDLAQLSKGFVKESSGVYKALFAVSKAFAIADGVVKLNQAIMNASVSLPFPANLAAMATVASAGLNLLTTIKSAAAPQLALKDGGWVSGPGGPRDDAVNVAASAGEFVVNAASAARNADLLEAINNGSFTAGQPGQNMTLNLTQNYNGSGLDQDRFRSSGRQLAQETARVVERNISRL